MGALKRWKTLGGGGGRKFFKFTKEEPVLEGIWRGTRPNKFNGENGIVEFPDGSTVEFTLSAVLKDLAGVKPGCEIRVEWKGLQQAKNGNSFNAFMVQVSEDAEVEVEEAGDVPF